MNSHKNKTEKKELTPRQWALYRLIKRNSLEQGRRTTQKEICTVLADYGYKYTESNNTSDHCSAIWNDVMENNLSMEHDKLIITKNYEYWIGTKEETKAFLQDLWNDIEPRLNRFHAYTRRIKRNGQGELFDKNGRPLWDFETKSPEGKKVIDDLFVKVFNDTPIDLEQGSYDSCVEEETN